MTIKGFQQSVSKNAFEDLFSLKVEVLLQAVRSDMKGGGLTDDMGGRGVLSLTELLLCCCWGLLMLMVLLLRGK